MFLLLAVIVSLLSTASLPLRVVGIIIVLSIIIILFVGPLIAGSATASSTTTSSRWLIILLITIALIIGIVALEIFLVLILLGFAVAASTSSGTLLSRFFDIALLVRVVSLSPAEAFSASASIQTFGLLLRALYMTVVDPLYTIIIRSSRAWLVSKGWCDIRRRLALIFWLVLKAGSTSSLEILLFFVALS